MSTSTPRLPSSGSPSARGSRAARAAHFTVFLPAISPERSRPSAELRALRIHRRTDLSLDDLAGWLNPIVAGWMHYYGRFYRSALVPLLRRINFYLRRWDGNKYRRLRTHKRFLRWWAGLQHRREPGLFAQWRQVHTSLTGW